MKITPLDQFSERPKTSDSVRTKYSTPIDATADISKNGVKRQSEWPFFPFFNPNLYFNPYYNQISSSLFKNLVDQYNNDLEMIRHRQNLLLKYTECSSPNSDKCKKETRPDGTEDLRAPNSWNWGYSRPDVEYVTYDRFYAVMNSFKTSIEKLTLRQNMLYEYVQCSCTAKTECSTSIKPVLDVMFSNNGNTTGQLIQSLFAPGSGYYNPASSFFQTLASYFSQTPSWFAYNFNPLTSAFGSYEPLSTSSSVSSSMPATSSSATTMPVASTHATTSPQTTPASSSSLESPSSGSQPVYSSSSSSSSATGSGQVSSGYVSSGGGGKPSQEQYFVSSNGENIHISSSNDGKGVSVSSVRPARQVGINPAQVGIQAAQIGLNAAQVGVQIGATAAQYGINAANAGVAAGLYGAHVPYF